MVLSKPAMIIPESEPNEERATRARWGLWPAWGDATCDMADEPAEGYPV